MQILLLGNTGQLGWELERTLAPLGDIFATDYPEFDLTRPDEVRQLIHQVRPQVIVNATAYTAVDRAESEPQLAAALNAHGPTLLAEEARVLGGAFIHFSTDFVFDGSKGQAYVESDTPNPLGVYGQTKLDGEQAVVNVGGAYLILRTSWVYSLRRDSFVTRILKWARERPTLKLVTDQVRSPTWCRMLAEATAQVLVIGRKNLVPWLTERQGIYHLAGSGQASMLEWGQTVLELDPKPEEQVVREILPALTEEFPTPARRPLCSPLNCERFMDTFGLQLPPWEEALKLALEEQCVLS